MELLQIDGVLYSSYGQYLSEVGHSSYYVRVQESDCCRWSSHPARRDPRDCAPNGGMCHCDLKIARLTVSYLISGLFLLRSLFFIYQQHISACW